MLSKIARSSYLKKASLISQKTAGFSSEIAKTDGATSRPIKFSQKDLSELTFNHDKEREASQADYYNTLAHTDARQRYFTALA